jgi:hypothetical protein
MVRRDETRRVLVTRLILQRGLVKIIVLVVVLLLASASIAFAKGPMDKVVITGPGLKGEIVITDLPTRDALGYLGAIDLARGAIPKPNVSNGYHVVGYIFDGATYKAWEGYTYYPDAAGAMSYIDYEGLVDPNMSSEFDGRWYYATSEADRALRDVIAKNATPAPNSSLLLLPTAGGELFTVQWLLALGIALTTSGLLLWRYGQRFVRT